MVDLTPFSPQINLTQPQGTFSNPYLGITNPFPGQWPPPKNSAFPAPVLAVTYDTSNNFKGVSPVNYTWNLMVERQLAGGWLARAGYVGSHGSHGMESIELNPSAYIPGSALGADARRVMPGYSNVTQVSYDVNSSFNSLQLTAERRFRSGMTLLANYTWSKSIDDLPATQAISGPAVAPSSPIPYYLPGRHQYDRGASDCDHRHRFVVSYVYCLPKLANANAFVRTAAGGWQLTGILNYMTGAPITILAGQDQSRTANNSDHANYLGGPVYGEGACGTSVRCVNYLVKSSFGLPAVGTFGNLGKGSVYGPDLFGWDAGLFKEFALYSEKPKMQFRAEFFNLLNRAKFQQSRQLGFIRRIRHHYGRAGSTHRATGIETAVLRIPVPQTGRTIP